jgi:hypothetical protein
MPTWIIATLIIFILFMVYLGFAFLFTVLELFINGALIYMMFWRTYVEIRKEKKQNFYLAGAVLAMVTYLIFRNFLSAVFVWPVTMYLLEAFILAQVIQYGMKKYYKKK